MSQFDEDISLIRTSETEYQAIITDTWQINVGPNGGYIAAIMLNALKQTTNPEGKAEIQTRSLTCHFLSPSTPGPATLTVNLEKKGRTLSSGTVHLSQGSRSIAIAVVSFANSREMLSFNDIEMPVVPAPNEIPTSHHMNPNMKYHAAFRSNYDQRLAIGPIPPAIADEALVGGWTRFRDTRIFDDLALLAISDSWYPAMYALTNESVHSPTIDHTVHFLHTLPWDAGDHFILVAFKTETAADGYLVEDGFLWTETGILLARSRQLAIILEQT